ncbi:hypothetical protein DEW08_06235 [Azospirillum thermophilum]|uniref:DNA primase n=2 Tax=Azospirillum thermophilum TaxID=2202148 RepID=A0A2S2CN95_9PROT|nr:hypothetical protein DEW08_06235 [Azospirillum thermophilum]
MPSPRPVSFDRVNAAALAALPAILARLFPAGKREGAEFVIGNLNGDPGRSLRVSYRKGCWRDFSADIGGADPVSLVAAKERVSQIEAARLLGRMLGVDHG